MRRQRFRKPEEITEAIQFSGDWNELRTDLGWTEEQLTDRWPRCIPHDSMGKWLFSYEGFRRSDMLPIDPGCWIILDGDHIVGIASENAFDGYQKLS